MKRSVFAVLLLCVFMVSQIPVFAAPNYNYKVAAGGGGNAYRGPQSHSGMSQNRPTNSNYNRPSGPSRGGSSAMRPHSGDMRLPSQHMRPPSSSMGRPHHGGRPPARIVTRPTIVQPVIRYSPPRANIYIGGGVRPYYYPNYYGAGCYYPNCQYSYYSPGYSTYYPNYNNYPTTTTTHTVIMNGVTPVTMTTPVTPVTAVTPVTEAVQTTSYPQQEYVEEPVPASYVQPQGYAPSAYGETITTTVVTDNRDRADKIIDRTGRVVGIVGVTSIIGLGIAALIRAL